MATFRARLAPMINGFLEAVPRRLYAAMPRGLRSVGPFAHLRTNVLPVRDVSCLKKAFGWTNDAFLDAPHLVEFGGPLDLNERRMRDAEALLTVCCNSNAKTILEIGTATGETTALIAHNAPDAIVHTMNIPPEEIGEGGVKVTRAFSRDEIGRVYRAQGCTNVRQIFANSARWEPNIGPIDIAFIDGCHDADFVFNDTRKVLTQMKPGSFVLWHDFNPELVDQYDWIDSVCSGVEKLYTRSVIRGPILHLRDSWIGIYRVP